MDAQGGKPARAAELEPRLTAAEGALGRALVDVGKAAGSEY